MNLDDRLDMVIHGYDPVDLISDFVSLWNAAGIMLTEDFVRPRLQNVPLTEMTGHAKRLFWRAMERIMSATTPEQRQNRSVDPEFIKEVLFQLAPTLKLPQYKDVTQEISSEIVKLLPHAPDVVEPEDEPVQPDETEQAFRELESTPHLWTRKVVNLPPMRERDPEFEKGKSEVPLSWQKKIEGVPSERLPDVSFQPSFTKRKKPSKRTMYQRIRKRLGL